MCKPNVLSDESGMINNSDQPPSGKDTDRIEEGEMVKMVKGGGRYL